LLPAVRAWHLGRPRAAVVDPRKSAQIGLCDAKYRALLEVFFRPSRSFDSAASRPRAFAASRARGWRGTGVAEKKQL
jgi:hypothetical protein